jgi:putative dimethyl sulfoxide reductase chaperone
VTPEIAEAIAEDAEMLAVLHDRELTAETVAALREAGFPSCLGLMPATPEAVEAWRAMEAGMASLPARLDATALDELASEYAAIYLTGAYGASPYESVWTDDDHLICQQAMFQWRDIHAAAGLAAADWRQRPDDHLVLQLLYLAHALRRAATADSWRDMARVLDEHTLRWLPDFAGRVAARSETPFYAGLAILTAAWVDTARDLIAAQLGEARPSREEIEERLKPSRSTEAEPLHFVPGLAPTI